jgi:hypothetical protein
MIKLGDNHSARSTASFVASQFCAAVAIFSQILQNSGPRVDRFYAFKSGIYKQVQGTGMSFKRFFN